jgi:hypothetical protein
MISAALDSLTCLNIDDVSNQAALRSARYDRDEFACDCSPYVITDYQILYPVGTYSRAAASVDAWISNIAAVRAEDAQAFPAIKRFNLREALGNHWRPFPRNLQSPSVFFSKGSSTGYTLGQNKSRLSRRTSSSNTAKYIIPAQRLTHSVKTKPHLISIGFGVATRIPFQTWGLCVLRVKLMAYEIFSGFVQSARS